MERTTSFSFRRIHKRGIVMWVVCSVISVTVPDKLDVLRIFLKTKPRLLSTPSINCEFYFIFNQSWHASGQKLSTGYLHQSKRISYQNLTFIDWHSRRTFCKAFETKKINSWPNFCYENFLKYLLERCVSEKLNKCDFKNIKRKFIATTMSPKLFYFSFWNSLTECVRWRCKIFSLIQRRKTFVSRLTRNETWKWRRNVTG